MKLYLISQNQNNGYDTFDSAVVAAESEEQAQNMHPGGLGHNYTYTWTHPESVKVTYLGEAKEGTQAGVICASFNAG